MALNRECQDKRTQSADLDLHLVHRDLDLHLVHRDLDLHLAHRGLDSTSVEDHGPALDKHRSVTARQNEKKNY